MNQCAIRTEEDVLFEDTCFTKHELINIFKEDDPIKLKSLFREYFENLINIRPNNFKPKLPIEWKKNPNAWLANSDIDNVLNTYDRNVGDFYRFKYIGSFPVDFQYKNNMGQCMVSNICNLQITDYIRKGISRLGIIFNLDSHYGPGTHWVSCFICLDPVSNKYGAYLYDSIANPIHPLLRSFLYDISDQVNDIKLNRSNFKIYQNITRRQFKNTECGVFSILFIIQMLTEKTSFFDICENMCTDDEIQKMRYILYR